VSSVPLWFPFRPFASEPNRTERNLGSGVGVSVCMRVRVLAALTLLAAGCMPPEWGANALLHPTRHVAAPTSLAHEDVAFHSDGLLLKGWLFRGREPRRGLIVYLHGSADNRAFGAGIARRLGPKGWDVLACDSRAHGESEGADCTYGYYERRDVVVALDAVRAKDAVLLGVSLGGAVALQAAPLDRRIRGVVAVSSFSDLETVARERAPWLATEHEIQEAFHLAERRGRFRVADASPVLSAPGIDVPVLLIHGAADGETPPEHSRRIFAALAGPKQLVLVPGAGHDGLLGRDDVWRAIDAWLARLASEA
jgi:pimeloyl-ACP methyl ester carboxylesterase